MTEVDESLLTLAKLDEVLHGDLDASHPLHEHAGLIEDGADRSVLSFIESATDSFEDTELGEVVTSKFGTDAATSAVYDERAGLASHLVGMTETEFDASQLTVTHDLLDLLYNNKAPAFVTALGKPNKGKTNTVIKLIDLYRKAFTSDVFPDLGSDFGELHVVSNLRSWSDSTTITSMYDLVLDLLEKPDRPTAILIDEGSTHFDARTNRRPVTQQWTPAAKRFAKLDVEISACIGHTGKDVHPEVKRLTTLALHKESKTEVQFYSRFPSDDEDPADPLYPDPLTNFEKTTGYDPDDAAPWAWNLPEGVFQTDASWPELYHQLKQEGPVTDD